MDNSAENNIFTSPKGGHELIFRNADYTRTSVVGVEMFRKDYMGNSAIHIDFPCKAEDNVAMALAVLGIGHVTDEVESRAQRTAAMATDFANEDALMEQAVSALRTIQILREAKAKESITEMDDAYAMYRLAYPDAMISREEFPGQSMHAFWITNLRKIRQDPTVLGAL